jgi:predicted dienelactone hydrolase
MKRVIFSITAALVLIAAVCTVWIVWSRSFPGPLPAPTGPYAVGRTEFDWRDDARPDPLDSSQPRDLDVLLWYPAEHQGSTPSAYVRADWLRDVERPFPMPKLLRAKTHSWDDVPLATPQSGGWPVAIFGSGFGSLPTEYSSLTEDLTSRGYVVVAAANTHYGLTVVFPDGHIGNEAEKLPPLDELVQIWAEDIRSVIKKLVQINDDSHSAFYHKLALRRFGVIGHSFGGAAAAQFCAAEPSCAAGIDMDGAIYADAPKRGIRAPFLFLVSDGTASLRDSKARQEWTDTYREYVATIQATCAKSAECETVIERGFRHANFTDSAALFRAPLVWFHPLLGSVERYDGLETLRQTIANFLSPRLNPIAAAQSRL